MSDTLSSGYSSLPLALLRRIDDACCRFESAWKAGRPVRIEECLVDIPEPAWSVQLRELLALEVLYRRQAHEPPTFEEYRARFPDHGGTIREVLACGIPARPSNGAASANGKTGPYAPPAPVPESEEEEAIRATFIDKYRLLRRIGSGGFGDVFLAEQRDGERPGMFAIKVVKRGLDTEDVLRRFRAEKNALSGLEGHPGIVTMFDAGRTADGRPYFAMQYVDGEHLDSYCDKGSLSVEERLRVFLDVLVTVQYAHKKLIVHRDLKPVNILVSGKDAQGNYQTKLLDFGLSKFLEHTPSSQTEVATMPWQRPMTPQYASPEQVRGEDRIDVRSDVYTLGVILYQLLTGHLPYRFNDRLSDMVEIVCEHEPEKPSTKVGRTEEVVRRDGTRFSIGPELVCKQRGCTLKQLRDKLKRDLDYIVLKALHKQREQRYQFVYQLEEDVRRFLGGEPILARPPSRWYAARKHIRKHWGKLGTAAAMFLALIGLSVWALAERSRALGYSERADELRRQAADERDQAKRREFAATLELVRREWYDAHIARAKELLARYDTGTGREQLREFSWHYYWGLCHSDRFTLSGHRAPVRGLAFAPDGMTLASGALRSGRGDETVRLWDPATGQVRSSVPAFTEPVSFLSFSPDGRRLAAVTLDGAVKLWDMAAAEPRALVVLADAAAARVAFTPDGQTLATGGGKSVRLWDATTGVELDALRWDEPAQGEVCRIRSMVFARDGNSLITGHNNGAVRLWDVRAKQQRHWPPAHDQAVYAMALAPDGRTLATGSADRTVKLWDVETGQVRLTLSGHTGAVHAVAFAPDGGTVASGGKDTAVRLWDAATGQLRSTRKGHEDVVTSVAFAPDGRALASASDDTTVKLWDATKDPERTVLRGHTHAVPAVAFSPDGATLASGSSRREGKDSLGEIMLWNVAAGATSASLREDRAIACLAFSPDGRTLATGSSESLAGEVTVWDVATHARRTIFRHTSRMHAVAYAPDGRTLASVGDDRTVRFWDVATGVELTTVGPLQESARSLAYAPDGQTLAMGGNNGAVVLLDVATKRVVAAFRGHGRPAAVYAVAFAPDGRTLASGSGDGAVVLYDLTTKRARDPLKGHSKSVRSLAFAPDGQTLASGSEDGSVRLWHVAANWELTTLYAGRGSVQAVAFAPAGGRRLAAGCSDGSVVLWSAGKGPGVEAPSPVSPPLSLRR